MPIIEFATITRDQNLLVHGPHKHIFICVVSSAPAVIAKLGISWIHTNTSCRIAYMEVYLMKQSA